MKLEASIVELEIERARLGITSLQVVLSTTEHGESVAHICALSTDGAPIIIQGQLPAALLEVFARRQEQIAALIAGSCGRPQL